MAVPLLPIIIGTGLFGAGAAFGNRNRRIAGQQYGNYQQQNVGGYNPTLGMPYQGPVSGWTDYYNPFSSRNIQYGWTQKDYDIARKAAIDNALAMEPIMEGAKQREYQRQMAAARYRQKIATEAQLTQQSQLGAQRQGEIASQSALGALAANYQYR
tara:strand:- start:767 stop:1234 length:468 start_codon:yes stop_codon:yes gene_type:complete